MTCTKCCKDLTEEEFYKDKYSSRGYKWKCKVCYPRRNSIQARRSQLKYLYNITPEDCEFMFRAQQGLCKICHEPSLARNLDVDHNHTTGQVRGLLCNRCNKVIGLLEEDSDLLSKAIEYLK